MKAKTSKITLKTTCELCSTHCGVLVHINNGRVSRVEGDPDCPVAKGVLCPKGLASLEYLYHPDRLRHPLRRVGERGQGKWQQVSWDEALSTIASELLRTSNNYGPGSVTFITGARKGVPQDWLKRLAHAFGTPNFCESSYVCFVPKIAASKMTFGFLPFQDYEYSPACLVIWGANVVETRLGEYMQTIQALNNGAKLCVIDCRKTEFAERAELWVQPRPGSDLALALGMINVIVNEGLFDKAFVDGWTVGFDKLKDHIQAYPPEKIEEITWIRADAIRGLARFYATNKPGCIQTGNALEHNINSFQVARAISILRAITGNLDVPGGDVHYSFIDLPLLDAKITLEDKIPTDKRWKKLGAEYLMPSIWYALPQMVTKAILNEDPYPIKAAYVQASNPLITWPNSQNTYRAFRKLDFLAVADIFMTPTAGLADIVLPAATYLEFDTINRSSYHPIVVAQRKVTEIDECWPDIKIINELAKKLGLGDYPWADINELLNSLLRSLGLTLREFQQIGFISPIKEYRKYERNGFETPSRKVELYSNQLKEWGLDPMPIYHEPPETSCGDHELAKEYPLTFTNWKTVSYRHSQGRQISSLRGSHPEPRVVIHPETAAKLEIDEGDWVYIETKRGRIKQKATLSANLDPRVIGLDYGWWFPENGASELYGWAESNINILTDDQPPFSPEMGTANLKGICCKVYKVF